MTGAFRTASAAILAATAIACSGTPAAPTPISLAGSWTGTGQDSGGVTTVAFALTQSGATVSGTVTTSALNPSDGSCNSCHRNKRGMIAGTISGATLTLSMAFPAGSGDDPTPICSASISGTAADIAARALTVAYSGADSCEGPLTNGTLAMTQSP